MLPWPYWDRSASSRPPVPSPCRRLDWARAMWELAGCRHGKDSMNRTRWIVALVAAAALSLGWAQHPAGPHCPTEDSCVADYHDGAWTITEVRP